jgi:hypothetical protein
MKLIAHRGNINGPNLLEENRPEYIDFAIQLGYNVEIDIRFDDDTKQFFLGHDYSKYLVNWSWLAKHRNNLWIHCKNIEALFKFSHSTSGFNYFWHENDKYTLTSKGYIWTYPGQFYTPKSVIVMPETYLITDLSSLIVYNAYGICTDYPNKLKK